MSDEEKVCDVCARRWWPKGSGSLAYVAVAGLSSLKGSSLAGKVDWEDECRIVERAIGQAVKAERERAKKALLDCLHLTHEYRPREFDAVAQAIARVAHNLGIDLKVQWQIGVQGNATDPECQD